MSKTTKQVAELLAEREFDALPEHEKRRRIAAGARRKAAMEAAGVASYRSLLDHYSGTDGAKEVR
jgi:hypothetical protein